jgi:hypothetical protein
MNIRPVGADFSADRRTDVTKVRVVFEMLRARQKSCAVHIMNNVYTFHLLMIPSCHQLYQYLGV